MRKINKELRHLIVLAEEWYCHSGEITERDKKLAFMRELDKLNKIISNHKVVVIDGREGD